MDDFDRNFGDSFRIAEQLSSHSKHIFDGAGENIQQQCNSDNESRGSRKSKARYINAAIYVENIETAHSATSLCSSHYEVTPHPHGSNTYRSNSTPFLSGRADSQVSHNSQRKSCRLASDDEDDINDDTARCDATYRDGHDTFRLSVASLSTTASAKEERERREQTKKEVYKAWLARKEQEKREKARLEKLKIQVVPQTTPQQREESYRRWLENKRKQDERKKAEEVMRRYRESEHTRNEQLRREAAKQEKFNEWMRKKEENIKLMKTKEERKIARAALEEEKRRNKGEKAYRDWLRTSRNKPLPVPLNQGELSMRGSISQMYINPIPWQSPN